MSQNYYVFLSDYFFRLKTRTLNGQTLLFLKKLRRDAPEFFYRTASDQLGLKDIQELMKFSNAIEEL